MELLAFAQSWLDPEGNKRSSPVQPKKAAAMWEEPLVTWFLSERELPLDPFELKQAVRVVIPQKFYASLREDIEVGQKGRGLYLGHFKMI